MGESEWSGPCLTIEYANLKFQSRQKWTPFYLNGRSIIMFYLALACNGRETLEWDSKSSSSIIVVARKNVFLRDFAMASIIWTSVFHFQGRKNINIVEFLKVYVCVHETDTSFIVGSTIEYGWTLASIFPMLFFRFYFRKHGRWRDLYWQFLKNNFIDEAVADDVKFRELEPYFLIVMEVLRWISMQLSLQSLTIFTSKKMFLKTKVLWKHLCSSWKDTIFTTVIMTC